MSDVFDPEATAPRGERPEAGVSCAAAEAPLPYLRLVYAEDLPATDPRLGDRYWLPAGEGGALVLGRRPDAGLERWGLPFDRSLSRSHARLWSAEESRAADVVVEDLGSRNGTFACGAPVNGAVVVSAGAVVRAGGCVFVVGHTPARAEAAILEDPVRRPPQDVPAWSWGMLAVWERLVRYAASDVPLLLTGEMGSGKSWLVRTIHARSPRAAGPLVVHNCATTPAGNEELVLFGVAGRTFTQVEAKEGLFMRAAGGTLCLDEFAELPSAAQAKLLQAIDTTGPQYTPLGAEGPLATACRVIAATNGDVDALVAAGRLRGDLRSRLAVAELCVPPLRERREDLLRILASVLGTPDAVAPVVPSAEIAEALLQAPWYENLRGLARLAEALRLGDPLDLAAVRRHGERGRPPAAPAPVSGERPRTLSVSPAGGVAPRAGTALRAGPAAPPPAGPRRAEWRQAPWPLERTEMLTLLAENDWSVTAAARAVGRSREALSRRLAQAFPGDAAAAAKDHARRAWRAWQRDGRFPSDA